MFCFVLGSHNLPVIRPLTLVPECVLVMVSQHFTEDTILICIDTVKHLHVFIMMLGKR